MSEEKNLWNRDAIRSSDIIEPKSIIQEQCDYLKDITQGKVIGRITEYDGNYQDIYEYSNNFELSHIVTGSLENLSSSTKTFDVQDVLGENNNFVYEFYITSNATSKYRYRIGFFYYNIFFYPMHIILEKSLADELGIEPLVTVGSETEFKKLLKRILNSHRVICVVQNLLSMNLEKTKITGNAVKKK